MRAALRAALAIVAGAGCKFPYPDDVPNETNDAAVDARVRTQPLVENNQAADLVIGQDDFVSATEGPHDPTYLLYGGGVAGDPDNLWISDRGANRTVRYSPFPAANHPAAVTVLGRATFTDDSPPGPADPGNMDGPGGVALTTQALAVVDSLRNRVLIWSPPPTSNGAPATVVLGQPNFLTSGAGTSAAEMSGPRDIWSDGVRLVVSDCDNNRVLIWNTFPRSNGDEADLVIGQSTFGTGAPPASPSAARMSCPHGVTSNGTWLAVADSGHNRVLIWRTFPTVNGAAADVVVGQDSFEARAGGTADARRLNNVRGLATFDGALFVADAGHHRVLLFDPLPSEILADVSRASRALGQLNPGVAAEGTGVTERSLMTPYAVAAADRYLFVSDWHGNRVLRFRLNVP